jgi:type I site-specific restriction endonuclease
MGCNESESRSRIPISYFGVMWVVCRLPCKALSFSENAFDDWHLSYIISERELTLNFAAMTDHDPIDKKALSERDICTKFITPAIKDVAGWDLMQFSEEFTLEKIFVKGKRVARGSKDRADYILFHNRDLPIAIIEAKDNNHDMGAGMQQTVRYAETIDVPFAYSSNGDGSIEHDRTRGDGVLERTATSNVPRDFNYYQSMNNVRRVIQQIKRMKR